MGADSPGVVADGPAEGSRGGGQIEVKYCNSLSFPIKWTTCSYGYEPQMTSLMYCLVKEHALLGGRRG